MRGTKFGLLLKLLLSISTFTIPLSVAGDTENAKGQQQFPYDAKEFRMDTWKYQEDFEFPDEENDGPWKQVHYHHHHH